MISGPCATAYAKRRSDVSVATPLRLKSLRQGECARAIAPDPELPVATVRCGVASQRLAGMMNDRKVAETDTAT